MEGLRRLCRGLIDVAGASRPITAGEQEECARGGVTFVELPVAHDAITIIVNGRNTWASEMTVQDLRTLWAANAEGRITRWNQVRPGWPDRNIALFGPGRESGTFDYFTDVINGSAGASRADYTASADDREITRQVAANEYALGYVGYSYFERGRGGLKALAIDDLDDRIGQGPIEPSPANVRRGVYRPLSRPLFIYVNAARLQRAEVKAFVSHYLRGPVSLPRRKARSRSSDRRTTWLVNDWKRSSQGRCTRRRTRQRCGSRRCSPNETWRASPGRVSATVTGRSCGTSADAQVMKRPLVARPSIWLVLLSLAALRAAAADLQQRTTRAYDRYAEITRGFLERARGGGALPGSARIPRDGEAVIRPGGEDGIIAVPAGSCITGMVLVHRRRDAGGGAGRFSLRYRSLSHGLQAGGGLEGARP